MSIIKGNKSIFLVGITGSIGSGKTYAAQYFNKRGCAVLNADEIAKSLYFRESKLLKILADEFGERILKENGNLNKLKFAEEVFKGQKAIQKLNQIVKPFLEQKIKTEILNFSLSETKPFIVLEAPVLFEYGAQNWVDFILLIKADEKLIIDRVKKRSALTECQIKQRLSNQISQEVKSKLSDKCIDNSYSFENFELELAKTYDEISAIAIERRKNK